MNRQTVELYPFLKYLPLHGVKSFLLFPIQHENNLLGMLEIASTRDEAVDWEILGQLQPTYAVGSLALLRRSVELANERINEVIKEQFTALAARRGMEVYRCCHGNTCIRPKRSRKISATSSSKMYTRCMALWISATLSVERGSAIRDDLQGAIAAHPATRSSASMADLHLPLLEELQFKNNRMLNSMHDTLFAEDEVKINEF